MIANQRMLKLSKMVQCITLDQIGLGVVAGPHVDDGVGVSKSGFVVLKMICFESIRRSP